MMTIDIERQLNRNVWCLLGLPFDSVYMKDVVVNTHDAVKNNSKIFLSTPNLNFLIESQTDDKFRDSVTNSNLSVADGKPIIWLAKLLRIPLPERVAGSDLIEELIKAKTDKPIKVFFFGGEDGVANKACKRLSLKPAGLKCVGYFSPGFGSVDDMSTTENINKINESDADFVIVSLGAKKGQAWIEKNKKKLNAPLISHLGAVVNFIAGTVNRSPKIIQRMGLEWLWRIKEEPVLWRRYTKDAAALSHLLLVKVLPLYVLIIFFKRKNESKVKISITNNVDIELFGYWGNDNISKINKIFIDAVDADKDVGIVIKKGVYVDSAFIAKIMLLKNILENNNKKLLLKIESKLVNKIFKYHCCEYIQ